VGTEIRGILVREGQLVAQGDVLIELDATVAQHELQIAELNRRQAAEQQQGEITAARQRLDAAKLALEQAQAAREPELAAQRKQLDVVRLKAEQAQADLTRLQALAKGKNPLVSAQQIDQQQAALRLAEAEIESAELALKRLEQAHDFNLKKAEAEVKAAEEALALAERGTALATLDRQIELARHKLSQTKVTAPSAGTVIRLLGHAGERVSSQPLLQIANLQDLQCQAEVDVADVPLLKEKHEAFISSRAFRGNKVKAKIERIRNVAGAATLRPLDPRKAVDRTVATVVLSVQAADAAQLLGENVPDAGSALMGLQVDVEIPL
jgi:ABC exporter DevB family membrane fusion protein